MAPTVRSRSRRLRKRASEKGWRDKLGVVVDMVEALNVLFVSNFRFSMSSTRLDATVSGLQQKCTLNEQRAVRTLQRYGAEACRRAYPRATTLYGDVESLRDCGFGYQLNNLGKSGLFLSLDPGRVSLPQEGAAGACSLLQLLPDSVKEVYRSPLHLVKRKDSQLQLKKPFLGMSTKKYQLLVEKLVCQGLCTTQTETPKIVNGIFGVSKPNGKHRLIIDARNANEIFCEPPKVELPNPEHLTNLLLGQEDTLYIGKTDIDCYYYRIKLPGWLSQFFGLPMIEIDGKQVWPVIKVLPMGWSHSVYLGQIIHQELLRKQGLDPACSVINKNIAIGPFRYGAYIDDFFVIGSNKPMCTEKLEANLLACNSIGLEIKDEKVQMPTAATVDVLGIEITEQGDLRPKKTKIIDLINNTNHFRRLRTWKRSQIQSLLGSWAWFILLRRPLFSIFESVYTLSNGKEETFRPTSAAREEFRHIISLAPLITARLKRQYAPLTLCTDASMQGAGVVYTRYSLQHKARQLTYEQRITWIQQQHWHTAVQYKWEHPEHINILEGRAIVLALRHVSRTTTNHGRRIVLFVDNTAVLGALSKGRSSSPALNQICRQVAALVLVADIDIEYYYVESKENPADKPSRS